MAGEYYRSSAAQATTSGIPIPFIGPEFRTSHLIPNGRFDLPNTTLLKTMKTFSDSMKVIHTSWLQYQTIISLWGAKPRRAPIDTEHPLVRTHPVTGLKALNINPGFSTRIFGLKKAESDKLFEFFVNHLADAADHQVRWKWEVGSVAMWDNRVTAHRVIPGKYKEPRRSVRTTVFGERPYFDPASEGREEREERIAADQSR